MRDILTPAVPLVTFLLGVAVPTVYRWISYDGLVISTLGSCSLSNVHMESGPVLVLHTAVVKVLNVTKGTVALESVTGRGFTRDGWKFEIHGMIFCIAKDYQVYMPMNKGPREQITALPVAVRSDEEVHVAVETQWTFTPPAGWVIKDELGLISNDALDVLTAQVNSPRGIIHGIRINGKLRNYSLEIGRIKSQFDMQWMIVHSRDEGDVTIDYQQARLGGYVNEEGGFRLGSIPGNAKDLAAPTDE
jgi:hypothetical protein